MFLFLPIPPNHFFVNETYERLVGDVGARIEEWVNEADSMRLIRDMENMKS